MVDNLLPGLMIPASLHLSFWLIYVWPLTSSCWPSFWARFLHTLPDKMVFIKPKHPRSQYCLRTEKTAVKPRANTTKYGLNSFAHEGARIWNSLPNVFRVNENYREFSRLIQNWAGLTCKCIICRQWICIYIQWIYIYSCIIILDTEHMQTDFPLMLSVWSFFILF